jgi:hypothetical protein
LNSFFIPSLLPGERVGVRGGFSDPIWLNQSLFSKGMGFFVFCITTFAIDGYGRTSEQLKGEGG